MRTLGSLVLLGLALGCQQAAATSNEPAARGARGARNPTGEAGMQQAEVTPGLAAKAEEILKSRPDAEIGTEIPFTFDGKRYVARFEEHENTTGDPNRPPGKHKGVTVYVPR